jgi:hypothetical protein
MSISRTGQTDVNVGSIIGDIKRGTPKYFMVGATSFNSAATADATAFMAAILTACKLPRLSAGKLFPFPTIQGTTDQTEAAKYGTLGYGLKEKLVDDRPGYEFQVLAGSTLEKQLKKLDGQEVQLFLYDGKVTWGVKDSTGNFVGAAYLLSMVPRPHGDGQNSKATLFTISIVNSDDFVINAEGVEEQLNTSLIKGLNDVTLESVTNTTNVWQFKALIKNAARGKDINLASVFGATLASASLWTAKTGVAFATNLAITSIALHADGDKYTVTFDSTAYTALTGGADIKVNLAAPSVLDAAGVTEVEGIALVIDKS